ncbi:MAG: type I-C CRISPR-associated protein Cas5c [Candidatus Margulisiibacteriota bacterium]|nr:type I-C CRISPR-associated protein Cas5c [Candidatus Margulisiibacteriota bacterium]
MGYGIKLKVWGGYACFTRPEMKAERVSYDVMTPSAARGILEAIYWKPAIKWVIDKIHVLSKIGFDNIRRNEVSGKISQSNVKRAMEGKGVTLYQSITDERQQRASMVLKNVAYIIEAHFEMTAKAGETDNPEKHYNIFLRRARTGQCFHRPYLGCREFPASFELIEKDTKLPETASELKGTKDLGWMLYDMEFKDERAVGIYREIRPIFFRAEMKDGIINVAKQAKDEVKR